MVFRFGLLGMNDWLSGRPYSIFNADGIANFLVRTRFNFNPQVNCIGENNHGTIMPKVYTGYQKAI